MSELASAGVVAGGLVGTIAMLLPNTTANDDVFYTAEQYAQLTVANTGVRINVKYLPDGAVSAYGFYTGKNSAWKSVPVIAASARGEQLVADLGQGIELIWTPAAEPSKVLGIPALEGVDHRPTHFVFPEVRQAEQILVNPELPPHYRDAIIWFPSTTGILPIYISLNIRNGPGAVTGIGQDVAGIWLAGAGVGDGAQYRRVSRTSSEGVSFPVLMLSGRHFGKRLRTIRSCLRSLRLKI